jgi:MFS transporter, DHA2 family, multidrug resistance protein
MPIVGLLVTKIDVRILVSLGFAVFGICSLHWGNLSMDISPWSLTSTIIISGFSLGFVFVPLSTVALGGLPPAQIGMGSGLFNLMRNVGGSVGISLVNTVLARHGQTHQTDLVRNLQETSPVLQQRLTGMTQFLQQFYSSADAQMLAPQMVGSTLIQQAQLWGYVDDLRYMGFACIACVPVVWLLKRVKAKEPIAAH